MCLWGLVFMNLNSILQTGSKKAVKTLSFRKSSILLSLTLVFFLLLSSLGNADVGNADSSSIITQTMDMDGDGLNDTLEDELGTDKTDKFGDKDMDGLYDFEEYLDFYGTPNNTEDTPKYNYNDSTSYDGVNGPILDIYHYFNLSSNKTAYLRDQNFTEANGGFTDYLLWNVSFTGSSAGGSYNGDVIYSNNTMIDVSFGEDSGRSHTGSVSYSHNTMIDVSFAGDNSGGSYLNVTSYSHNTMIDVSFTGRASGGSHNGSVSYSNNTMIDVNFIGWASGGSEHGDIVSYSHNNMTNIGFSGIYSGGYFQSSGVVNYGHNMMTNISFSGDGSGGGGSTVNYSHNTLTNVNFSGLRSGGSFIEWRSGGSRNGSVSYSNNTMNDVSFSGLRSGGSRNGSVSYSNNMMNDVSFTGEGSGGSYYGNVSYTNNTISNILLSGIDASESVNGTSIYADNVIVNDSYDTDGDGLGDGYELFESGTDPRVSDSNVTSNSEINTLNSFTLLVALSIFISFSIVLVVYRVRRRVL